MAQKAAETKTRDSSTASAASALGNLNLSGASGLDPMYTSEGNATRSSGRGSMGAPSKGELRGMKPQEKEEAKRARIEKDEAVFKVTRPAVVDLELRNRGVQMEMTRGTTLRKTEKKLGERRSGQQPELGEGYEAWKGAAVKLKVELVKQGEAKRSVLKTKKRMLDGKLTVKRVSGAANRAKKGKAASLREKVEKERAAMTVAEEGKEQPATATSTPKPAKKQQQQQPQRQQQQTQHQKMPQWAVPSASAPSAIPSAAEQIRGQQQLAIPAAPSSAAAMASPPANQQQRSATTQAAASGSRHRPKSVVIVPTTSKKMRESGLTVEKGTEKGAVRKTSSQSHAGTRQTEKRLEAELKEKRENKEWQKQCKERSDGWEKKRLDHLERMKNTSAWVGGRSIKAHEAKKGKEEEEEEERDNIVETRFETSEDFGPLQPLPPYPASVSVSWVSASEKEEKKTKEEEKSRKARGKTLKGGMKGGKGMKGLTIKPPSYAQLKDKNEVLRKMFEEEREKNATKKKDKAEWRKRKSAKSSCSTASDDTLKRRSLASDASTIKSYEEEDEEDEISSPPSRVRAKPKSKEGTPMEAE